MAFATSIRISQAAGMDDRARVRRVCASSMTFAICWTCLIGLTLVLLHNLIPHLFTRDPEVIRIAGGFLFIAGLFQVFDGMQCTAMGALRGLKDVVKPTLIALVIYWLVEIPLAWTLCFHCHLGGKGIWLSTLFSLMLSATFLTVRMRRVAETKALRD
jgi:MATE family multidrug resistance protein